MINTNYELKEVTPKELRCALGPACPAIYEAKRITPNSLRCGIAACPEIYIESDSYFIVGKIIPIEEARSIKIEGGKTLADKVGQGETLIKIPKDLIDKRDKT